MLATNVPVQTEELAWEYDFSCALLYNTRILLLHRGEHFTSCDIREVLYHGVITGTCMHCGCGSRAVYIARTASNVIFLVCINSGCNTYDPSSDVESFDDIAHLLIYLRESPGVCAGALQHLA